MFEVVEDVAQKNTILQRQEIVIYMMPESSVVPACCVKL